MRAIRVENLSKRYFLGGPQSNSLRDAIVNVARGRSDKKELWALHDVSFDVADGEALGVIGHNGAGKSTLLKVLSRITKPTSGHAEIRGRVGSLLEVGTGFHNELTGRENIFLNGAVLGMKRSEIAKKFDEIVAFSEMEKFLDTPVKHYSSGMYMRLAFAVAAHLEPEVLIVDEVLAVGDVGFQKKCLRKMREVGASGRTVLFVSHDMNAITRLCSRVIWLKDGAVAADGEANAVVTTYLNDQATFGAERIWEAGDLPAESGARLRRVRARTGDGEPDSSFDIRKPIGIEMTYEVVEDGLVASPNIHLYNDQGVCLFVAIDLDERWRRARRPKGVYTTTMWIPPNFLAEGMHFATFALTTFRPLTVHFAEKEAIAFRVVDSLEGDSARGDYAGALPGVLRPILDWDTEFIG
jgi:lipopolysaccharide transport system ATP-binding protein